MKKYCVVCGRALPPGRATTCAECKKSVKPLRKVGYGPVTSWRCVSCGKPSSTYRCPSCKAKWLKKHGIKPRVEEGYEDAY